MLIKGVKFNRDENDENVDYVYVDRQENQGLRFYLHKYFMGLHPFYLQKQYDKDMTWENTPTADKYKQQ